MFLVDKARASWDIDGVVVPNAAGRDTEHDTSLTVAALPPEAPWTALKLAASHQDYMPEHTISSRGSLPKSQPRGVLGADNLRACHQFTGIQSILETAERDSGIASKPMRIPTPGRFTSVPYNATSVTRTATQVNLPTT
ncbi:hypothetical protein HK405_001318, partial [Cladochytrium tenue]